MDNLSYAFIGNLGPMELIIIAGVVVLLFGTKKLPELGKNLGKAARELKRGLKEGGDEPTTSVTPEIEEKK
ncbi:MAG TPA: twin-arginine translocase TatA/TatE family subunit [Bdellovibrionota bacterium]|nr:twin-arginine translocase TatA/TatE family subunit [Bdellovibrionota bacterium]